MPRPTQLDRVIGWLERMLVHEEAIVRARAVALLEHVEFDRRAAWLECASHDPDESVRDTALCVRCTLDTPAEDAAATLLPEQLAADDRDGLDPKLKWRWEHYFELWSEGGYLAWTTLVWTDEYDEELAREQAARKLEDPQGGQPYPVLTHSRFVNEYTRSATSYAEAMMWHAQGRPKPPE